MHGEHTLIQKMQSLEFTGLVGLGAASLSRGVPMMCNGANIAYTKQAFQACGGYAGDEHASGDDTSLLYSMHQRYPGKVIFLKSEAAIVKTMPQSTAREILHQRIRWSSKIPVAANTFTRAIAALAFFFHAFLLVGVFIPGVREYALASWLLKSLVELEFLKRLVAFFDRRSLLLYFALAQIVYPIYIVFTGLLALRGEYSWKGRRQVV
jgi:biofilm PGA synthesis N-glycosyltransferase PgaC